MVNRATYILFIALLLSACNKLDIAGIVVSSSAGVEERFNYSSKWNDNNGDININSLRDNYKVYIATDTHIESGTKNLISFLNSERNDSNAIFSVITGDLINQKGAMQTFVNSIRWNPATQKENDTLFTVVGNHDLYFNSWEEFKKFFHTSSYYVSVSTPTSKDLFIFLDSANGTLGSSQFDWLKTILTQKRATYRHCIIFTHSNLFRVNSPLTNSGNYPIDETYRLCNLFTKHKIDCVITGHSHSREVIDYGDVKYVVIEDMKESSQTAGYMVLTCGEELEYLFKKINSIY